MFGYKSGEAEVNEVFEMNAGQRGIGNKTQNNLILIGQILYRCHSPVLANKFYPNLGPKALYIKKTYFLLEGPEVDTSVIECHALLRNSKFAAMT